MENTTDNKVQKKRINKKLVYVTVVAAVLLLGCFAYFFCTRQSYTKTSPFGLRIEKQKQIVNALGKVDYYVYYADNTGFVQDSSWWKKAVNNLEKSNPFKKKQTQKIPDLQQRYEDWERGIELKGEGDMRFSAIYSYDYEAGFDFKKHRVEPVSSDILLVHYPEILYNDKSGNAIYLYDESREANKKITPDETKPFEVAVDKLAKDYAKRSQILEDSRDAFNEYLSNLQNATKKYEIAENDETWKTIKFAYSPLEIQYSPENLKRDYSFIVDTTRYNTQEFMVHDNYSGKDVYRISYESEWNADNKKTIKFMQDYYLKYVSHSRYLRVVDSENPDSKLVFFADDGAHIFINGKYYVGSTVDKVDGEYENEIKPDMIYLLNCIHGCKDTGKLDGFLKWRKIVNDCWDELVYKGRPENVSEKLKNVPKLVSDVPSLAEKCIESYVAICNDTKGVPYTGDPNIDAYIDFYNCVNSSSFKFNEDSRNRYKSITVDDVELGSQLRRLFLKDDQLGEEEINSYRNYLIQNGSVDPELFRSLTPEKMAEYCLSITKAGLWSQMSQEIDGVKPIPKEVSSKVESESPSYYQTGENFAVVYFKDEDFNLENDKDKAAGLVKDVKKIVDKNDTGDKFLVWINPKKDNALVLSGTGIISYSDYNGLVKGKGDFKKYEDLTEDDIRSLSKMFPKTQSNVCSYFLQSMNFGYNHDSVDLIRGTVKEMIKEALQKEIFDRII